MNWFETYRSQLHSGLDERASFRLNTVVRFLCLCADRPLSGHWSPGHQTPIVRIARYPGAIRKLCREIPLNVLRQYPWIAESNQLMRSQLRGMLRVVQRAAFPSRVWRMDANRVPAS